MRGGVDASATVAENIVLQDRLAELQRVVHNPDYARMRMDLEFDVEDGTMTVSFWSNPLEAAEKMEYTLSEITEIDKEAALIVLREKYRRRAFDSQILPYRSPETRREKALQEEVKYWAQWWDFGERCAIVRGRAFEYLNHLSYQQRGGSADRTPRSGSVPLTHPQQFGEGHSKFNGRENDSEKRSGCMTTPQTTLPTSSADGSAVGR